MTLTDKKWGEEFLQRWTKVARESGMKRCLALTKWRMSRIADARDLEEDLDVWEASFREVAANPFFRGENGRGWRAGVDYVLRDIHMGKVLDAGYEAKFRAEQEREEQDKREAEAIAEQEAARLERERRREIK